jgi:hypothetical protein
MDVLDMIDDDLREMRGRQTRLREMLANQRPDETDCHDDGVGVTTAAATVGKYVTIQPSIISGPETNGSTPTFGTDTTAAIITAVCLGPNAPGSGILILYSVEPGGRYVFNY